MKQLNDNPLYLSLGNILSDTCQFGHSIEFTELPERDLTFAQFPVRRIIKKRQAGKDKSTRGFVWIDTDPNAILLNKYIKLSCHTLDNTRCEYRSGNLNHVYCPSMACVFAGRYSPNDDDSIIVARSPNKSTKGAPVADLNRQPLLMRRHQAVANVWIMHDDDGREYLICSRLYDTCTENPWADTIRRYLMAHCKREGLGLAMATGDTDCGYWGKNGTMVNLQSMPFTMPFGCKILLSYIDDVDYKASSYGDYVTHVHAYEVLAPSNKRNKIIVNPRLYYSCNTIALSDLTEPDAPAVDDEDTCYGCGGIFSDNDMLYGPDEHYCGYCYSQTFSFCDGCQEEALRNNLTGCDSSHFCRTCYNDLPDCGMCGNRCIDITEVILDNHDKRGIPLCHDCLEDDVIACCECNREVYPDWEYEPYCRVPVKCGVIAGGEYNRFTQKYKCIDCCNGKTCSAMVSEDQEELNFDIQAKQAVQVGTIATWHGYDTCIESWRTIAA